MMQSKQSREGRAAVRRSAAARWLRSEIMTRDDGEKVWWGEYILYSEYSFWSG